MGHAMETLLRAPQACRFLGIGRKKLRSLCNKGLLTFIRYSPSGPRLFDPKVLDAFKAKHTFEAKVEKPKVRRYEIKLATKEYIPESRWGSSV